MNTILMTRPATPGCSVQYDKNGQRVTKAFADVYAARRFYVEKLKAGKNPKVLK